MKFLSLAISALFASSVMAVPCDPSKITSTFYKDSKCTVPDKVLTDMYHTVPESEYGNYKPGCHPYRQLSFKLYCDAEGIHQPIFMNDDCKKPFKQFNGGLIEYEWDKCV